MKKIAVLSCLKSNTVCTGAACFRAYNERIKSFARYKDEEMELVAFSKCNGCGNHLRDDAGLQEKLERLVSIGTEVVHLGLCVKNKDGTECEVITEIADELTNKGITVIRGTH